MFLNEFLVFIYAQDFRVSAAVQWNFLSVVTADKFVYRAQNEAYKDGDGEKWRKSLPIKELCVMTASGRAKRNVYMGLHDV